MKRRSSCYHCGTPATLLCDFILGYEGSVSLDSRVFTCDRPLCRRCADSDDPIFFCGKEGGVVVKDYCKDHAPFDERRPRVITEAEAEAIRNRDRTSVLQKPEARRGKGS
jgi:hypothetical protein